MKKFLNWFLVLSLFLVSCVFLASCGEEEDLLTTFIFEHDTNEVSEDFVVDSQLTVGNKSYDLTWASDSEYVKFAAAPVDGKYTATVTRPEGTEEVTVKITVSVNKESKEFTVRVRPLDVYDFSGTYAFPQNNAIVYSDFDLPTSYTYLGKTCTISWASNNAEYAEINAEGNKAIITPSSVVIAVRLTATFTYNGETTNKTYRLSVSTKVSPYENIINWYSDTGISQTLNGYVIGIGTAYSDTYSNVSFYMVDETFDAGYYIYRVKSTPEEAAQLEPGAYVTITGSTNTVYNGLFETNQDGNLTVDETKEKINVMEKVYALDDDLIANAQSVLFRQSSLVSLNGWRITEKTAAPAFGQTTSMLKVERDGVSLTIAASKYMEGFYNTTESAADPKFTALVSKYNSLNVGDYINVTGILGYYNAFQVIVLGAESITTGTAPSVSAGVTVGPVIEGIEIPEEVNQATTIDLVTTSNGVTISWELSNDLAKTVKVENNKLVITPEEKAESVNLIGTYKLGNYETKVYYPILTQQGAAVDPTVITVEEAKAKPVNEEVLIQGTVLATSLRGYIVYDGTAAVYVYANGSLVEAEKNFTYKVNDVVKIEGKMGFYNGIQIVPTSSEVVAEAKPVAAPAAVEMTAAEMDTYVAGPTYANTLVTITGTLSINDSFYNLIVDGAVTAQGSLSYLTEAHKAELADLNGKEVTATGWLIGASSAKYANILVSDLDYVASIATAKKAANGEVVTVEGVIAAVSNRGYIVYDGTDAIYVYAYGSTVDAEKNFTYKVGDKIKVTGARGWYNGDQIVPTQTSASTIEVTLPEAVELTGAQMDTYINGETYACQYVKFTGVLEINDRGYYNVTVAGATTAVGSLSYIPTALGETLTTGKTYEFYGWAFSISMSNGAPKFLNVVFIEATEK